MRICIVSGSHDRRGHWPRQSLRRKRRGFDRARKLYYNFVIRQRAVKMEAKIISLRVSPSVAQALERAARARRVSKSRIILESLKDVLEQPQEERSSFEIGKDLFGRHGSGRRDTARRHRELYREYVSEKHARRQRSARRAV